jgi:signal transduction histidine kinase
MLARSLGRGFLQFAIPIAQARAGLIWSEAPHLPRLLVALGRCLHGADIRMARNNRSRRSSRPRPAPTESDSMDERAHLARELHDQVGQILTLVKIDLSLLIRSVSSGQEMNSEATRAALLSVDQMVDAAISSVQKIAYGLRPAALAEVGFLRAIAAQVQGFEARIGIPCRLEVPPGEWPIDQARAREVYRVLQEALTNVARHARAGNVGVAIDRQEDTLLLEVTDDGVGIDRNAPGDPACLGLTGMRERATLLGGSLTLQSRPGGGTRVLLRVPVYPRRGPPASPRDSGGGGSLYDSPLPG